MSTIFRYVYVFHRAVRFIQFLIEFLTAKFEYFDETNTRCLLSSQQREEHENNCCQTNINDARKEEETKILLQLKKK